MNSGDIEDGEKVMLWTILKYSVWDSPETFVKDLKKLNNFNKEVKVHNLKRINPVLQHVPGLTGGCLCCAVCP